MQLVVWIIIHHNIVKKIFTSNSIEYGRTMYSRVLNYYNAFYLKTNNIEGNGEVSINITGLSASNP